MVERNAMLDNLLRWIPFLYITLWVCLKEVVKVPMVLTYHLLCMHPVELFLIRIKDGEPDAKEGDPIYLFFCGACGETGICLDWKYELGTRTIPNWWVQNPVEELPPIIRAIGE